MSGGGSFLNSQVRAGLFCFCFGVFYLLCFGVLFCFNFGVCGVEGSLDDLVFSEHCVFLKCLSRDRHLLSLVSTRLSIVCGCVSITKIEPSSAFSACLHTSFLLEAALEHFELT